MNNNKNTVTCKLCNKKFKSITNTHLNKSHNGLTLREYIDKFGEFKSDDTKQRKIESNKKVDWAAMSRKNIATKNSNRIAKYGELTNRQLQIAYGGLLGDFGIHGHSKHRFRSNYLEVYHSNEQLPYLQWCIDEFSSINSKLHRWTRYWDEYNKEYTRNWMTTASHPTITNLRKECYSGTNGKKVVTTDWIYKVESLGLAVWYMDDGSFKIQDSSVLFHTEGFSLKEHKIIVEYFKEKWDITATYQKSCKGKNGNQLYLIYISKYSIAKLFDIITEFIHPCMEYKLGKIKQY